MTEREREREREERRGQYRPIEARTYTETESDNIH